MERRKVWSILGAVALTVGTAAVALTNGTAHSAPLADEPCRPDGLYRTPGVEVPYCTVYDTAGREKMGADHPRRIIGYFTSWRHGKNGQPAYLVNNIPWNKLTHISYAFAHVNAANQISVGGNVATNPAIGMTGRAWPGPRWTRACRTRATSTC